MKTMTHLDWNCCLPPVEMGKGLNKYPPAEWFRKWGPLHPFRREEYPRFSVERYYEEFCIGAMLW
jgi:hypothetical protein